jgi:FkbM family methyltransferase
MDFQLHPHALTRLLVGKGVFARDPLKVVDVGCSHGLSPVWRCFEPSLRVLAVDTDADECRRLQSVEINPGVAFLPRRLGVSSEHPLRAARIGRDYWSANPWPRTSAAQAMSILSARESPSPTAEPFMPGSAAQPIRELTLDELVKEEEFGPVDVIKVDVDGPDLQVLVSGEQTIRTSPVLGVVMEVNFYGSHDETDHTFHATDRLMRSFGFELFDLTTRRCSVTALPGLFREDNAPYETLHGRIMQGDALYLRDPCGWDRYPDARVSLKSTQILKLAALMEIFGAPDHAAELLLCYETEVSAHTNVPDLLHLLARQVDPCVSTYKTFVERFQGDPTSHYPSRFSKAKRISLLPSLRNKLRLLYRKL